MIRGEGETREAREGKQGETRRRVFVRRRGDPGEIQGRSIDLRGSVFRGVGGSSRRTGGGVESKVWGYGREEDEEEAGARTRQGR